MFRKAEKKKSKLRLALCGVAGSGKTYSALKIAKGLGGKVAMIDTESGSGDLYSDQFDYDIVQLHPPFSPDRYVKIIHEAEKQGYDVLIIDSLSHAWAGEGGVLDIVDKAARASASRNSYTAWKDATPEQNKLIDAILTSKIHIITTMRSKSSYEMVDDKGKKKPVKIGLSPIQREGVDYEFTVVLDISIDSHIASASKDRTGIFDSQYFKITEETGEKLIDWLNSGVDLQEKANLIIEQIKNSHSIDELSAIFHDYCKSKNEVIFQDENIRNKIIDEKDKRKSEILIHQVEDEKI